MHRNRTLLAFPSFLDLFWFKRTLRDPRPFLKGFSVDLVLLTHIALGVALPYALIIQGEHEDIVPRLIRIGRLAPLIFIAAHKLFDCALQVTLPEEPEVPVELHYLLDGHLWPLGKDISEETH